MPDEEKKKPLDMTSDEAIDYLFGKEGADKLREIAGKNEPPPCGESETEAESNSARKQDTT